MRRILIWVGTILIFSIYSKEIISAESIQVTFKNHTDCENYEIQIDSTMKCSEIREKIAWKANCKADYVYLLYPGGKRGYGFLSGVDCISEKDFKLLKTICHEKQIVVDILRV